MWFFHRKIFVIQLSTLKALMIRLSRQNYDIVTVGCLNSGRAFYRYWAEQKEKVICYFHQYPVKDVSLNVSSENALKYITNKYKQSNITEAITPTLEDLRNFHYAALLEYPEYAKGIAGALFGLFFVRYDDFITDDLSGMYNGKMIWYDGTPVKTDFSSFYDPPFDPRINKSNCYRFMTWTSKDNDCYPKKCALGDHGWQGADGEVHCFSIAYKLSNYTEELYSIDDSLCDIQRKRRHISMYPATFRNKDEYQFIVEKLRDDLNTDQPIFYQYHTVLFGLWYFRGVGYRWNDFSQNSDFGFIDPNFSPQRNISQCYRFLAIPC
uniref:Uncharacterized protein n=1 Tax=Setaria digitata TaxID=48799 RepID=A0A915PTG9_9BILA